MSEPCFCGENGKKRILQADPLHARGRVPRPLQPRRDSRAVHVLLARSRAVRGGVPAPEDEL